jgi:uncharacterized protein (TIGR03083 family)
MASNSVAALRAEREEVLQFCRRLTPQEWEAPSGCPGWSVKGVVSHMGAAFHGCFTPWFIGLMRTDNVERSSDKDVARRASWDPAKVLSEYERWSGRYLAIQGLTRPLGGVKIPLGELGRYPLGIFPAAFTFDHHTHLRHDIAEALGKTPPPTDDARMAVVLEWMMAGLPQMCRQAMTVVDQPLDLTLTGPGGATWGLSPGEGGLLTVTPGGTDRAKAEIIAVAQEFVLWGTKRRPWGDYDVKIKGDEEFATRFLDVLNIV